MMGKRPDKRLNPNLLLLLALLAAGAVLAAAVLLTGHRGAQVQVRVDGRDAGSYSLLTNRTVTIAGYNGGTNLLVIENGTARVEEASCPDGLCVNTGSISRTGQSIVCLPNRVVVEITGETGDEEQALDMVAK